MNENTVIYVGPYSFPNGGAAARRILGVCASIRDAGFNVAIASGQMESEYEHEAFDGFPVFSLNERKHEALPKLMKHLRYLSMGSDTVKWLDSLPQKPKAIVLYSGYSPYLLRVGRWCEKNGVKFVFDAVEWYEAPNLISKLSPYFLNISLAMRFLLPKVGRLICISSYLQKYYEGKGCQVVKIPPTLDTKKTSPNVRLSNRVTKISYTGNPGRKDLLEHVIKAVIDLNESGFPVELNLAGKCDQILEAFSIHDMSFIKNHGFLSHDDSLSLVRNSDYTVLFRPYQRSSEAGFSTKFVESISLGTPVLANITSDLASHLLDGETGFVSDSVDYAAIRAIIERAVKCSDKNRSEMRKACITHAIDNFDYRNFIEPVKNFLLT